ncbi:unnamed protein product [Gongylonema pulchrum]|uniref:Soluble calcium-activated nucleotidase 1 n=1 Tax=Gongylonema pulchrum TaxID=637853 RepID=A0A183EC97_9BILA|nr:unnamed protein product [Gongylonema pulchrum]
MAGRDEQWSDSRAKGRKDEAAWSTGSLLAVAALTSILCAAFASLTLSMRRPGCYRRPYNSTLLVVVTDLDKNSLHSTKKYHWQSYMKEGVLTLNNDYTHASVLWDDKTEISLYSTFAAGGRSMELSDLVVFDGRLLSVDDRTGILYRIEQGVAYPWVYVSDGDGSTAKGFKGEWMTVKDDDLWVGGLGKEWTTTEGVFVNFNPMWVKRVTREGTVEHINWIDEYKKLRSALGIEWPGYMIHESAQWSTVYRKWFFLPRRASKLTYTEAEDEERGGAACLHKLDIILSVHLLDESQLEPAAVDKDARI